MKKYWIRFISFSLLFSFLFSLLNLATSMKEDRWMDFYDLPRDSLDVVFMGNSHNYVAIQPQIIDDIVPVRSYVIGGGGENVALSYYELREVLKYQHPKVVVLETYTLDLNDQLMPTQNYFGFLDSGPWDANKTAVALRYLSPEEWYMLFPALRTRMEWNRPHMYYAALMNSFRDFISPTPDPALGAAPLNEVMPEADYQAARVTTVTDFPQPSPEIAYYLDRVRELCMENDIQLVLTTIPMVNKTQSTAGRYAPFDAGKYAAEYQLPLAVYDPGEFNHLHYAEYAHLNRFGSLVVSTQMAQQLAVLLDLPVDEERMEYYQNFKFTNYSLDEENGSYTLRLFPRNSGADLEYNFSVTDPRVPDPLYRSGWTSNDEFSFPLDHDGRYDINVAVRDPHGDYMLTATFILEKMD
jgi:hypothetical protein